MWRLARSASIATACLLGAYAPTEILSSARGGTDASESVDANVESPVISNSPEARNSGDPIPPVLPPEFLSDPFGNVEEAQEDLPAVQTPIDPPLGFTGPSGIVPEYLAENAHFVPMEDRWRLGFPEWDRTGQGQQPVVDSPYMLGRWWDPYNQNVLKGDYPVVGNHTFLNLNFTSLQIFEPRQVPTGTTAFESMARPGPGNEDFFQNPNQFFYTHYLRFRVDVFHGDAAFKPVDWQVRLTPIFNVNYLDVEELGVVSPDVRKGTTRARTWGALEEWFVETKLADLSGNYDFVSIRGGSQFFNADFRGLLFVDTNRAVRIFGTRNSNREQFNLIFFDQTDKNINSLLNSFDDRHQNTLIANYYKQDFVWPGYTSQCSLTYNDDQPSFRYDANQFLARPDPTGAFQPHHVQAVYFGWTGNGHIERINISHAFYWAVGRDSFNPIASRPVDINAQMAALELSYDRDWVRFRTSFLYYSGDDDPNDREATGFDSVFDNPAFAGGEFSYWQRQAIRLNGVNLVQVRSFVPDLRSSKFQGQSNFVNPGLLLGNIGMDFEATPKLRFIQNNNVMWFDSNEVLETFLFQDNIGNHIGYDISLGAEYRPLLSNNIILVAGVSTLIPGNGFKDLYGHINGEVAPLWAAFTELSLTY